jgi:hypothetical protein
MNHAGDAAEQIVRMSLEGVEVAARITGTAAKEIAVFLIAALKSDGEGKGKLKLKGRARLESMLKSGKPLEIFSVRESDLQKFAQGAKQYGIVYCVLRDKQPGPDGLCDIMVKADDAPKINRLVERFKFATVDKAKIESEIAADRTGRTAETEPERESAAAAPKGAEPEAPDMGDTEKLLDELLGTDEGKATPDVPDAPEPEAPEPAKTPRSKKAPETPETPAQANPAKEASERAPLAAGGPPNSPLSGPTSETEKRPARGTSSRRPSVKAELDEIKAARRVKEAEAVKREEPAAAKSKDAPAATHRQPQNNRRPKSKKSKAR